MDDAVVDLAEDGARLRIDHFGLSSNNVTYGVYGDAMAYWDFFPADDGWGRIPVWGFADVVETRSSHLAVGERLFGYYPMATELVVTAGEGNDRAVVDTAPHRAAMAKAYSRYVRCGSDPLYRADREREQLLLYPLFMTSFLIDDLLADAGDFGAEQVVVSSASSKTAIGVAHCGRRRGPTGRADLARPTSGSSRASTSTTRYGPTTTSTPSPCARRPSSTSPATPTSASPSTATWPRTCGTHDRRQHALGPRDRGRRRAPARTGTGVLLRSRPDRQAQRGVGPGRAGPSHRRGLARLRRLGRRLDRVPEVRGAEAVTEVYREFLAGRPDPRAGFICSLAAAQRPDRR